MIPDGYEISELRRMLETENRAMANRTKVFSFALGMAYLLVGLFCWEEMVRPWHIVWQVGGFLLALATWPLILALLGIINRVMGHWPRCPECQAKLKSFPPALRRCPACHHVIVFDRRKWLPGYTLPDSGTLKPRNPNKKTASMGMFAGQLLILAVFFIPLLLAKYFISPENADIPLITARLLMFVGGYVIFFHCGMVAGFARLLILVVWIDRKCDKLNRKLDKNYKSVIPDPEHLCPHCHREPDHRLAAVTGNCSHCGGPMLTVADEPDTPEMMDFRSLHRYSQISGISIWYLCGIILPGCVFGRVLERYSDGILFWAIAGTLFVGIPAIWCFAVLRILRKKWKLNFRCPFCRYQAGPSNSHVSWRILLWTGHCPACLRKLVRDDDADK